MFAFISHAERDVEALHTLENALRHEGIDFYVAEEDHQPGLALSEKILSWIHKSDVLIALMTKAASSSPSVNQEIGIAIKLNRTVIPLVQKDVDAGILLDNLEQLRFDDRNLDEICRKAAGCITQLKQASQALSDDPYMTKVSAEFIRCGNGAYAFHNCAPADVKTLLLAKYDYFMKRPESHYPQFFDKARDEGLVGKEVLTRLYETLYKAPEEDRDKVLTEYVTCLYLIDAAVIAHLKLRKGWSELTYRDECEKLVKAYSERLRSLYDNEIGFGRSEVHRFLHQDDIVTLLNATQSDAIDYIVTYLADAMWCQLNGSHGWFDEEAERAEADAETKTRILNKARQRKAPLKRKLYRATRNRIVANEIE